MSLLAHIGRDIPKKLITAILQAGQGKRLLESMSEAPGVLSISHHHARGIGGRRIRAGRFFASEQDVLIVLVEAELADVLFARIHAEGKIGEPGSGLIFIENVLRGHPMMPFQGADW